MTDNVKMPAVPGFAVAPGANQIVPPVDWVDPPARIGKVYGARVCAVDADGNEVAGIRLPPIAVPFGTHTGWNVFARVRARTRATIPRDTATFDRFPSNETPIFTPKIPQKSVHKAQNEALRSIPA